MLLFGNALQKCAFSLSALIMTFWRILGFETVLSRHGGCGDVDQFVAADHGIDTGPLFTAVFFLFFRLAFFAFEGAVVFFELVVDEFAFFVCVWVFGADEVEYFFPGGLLCGWVLGVIKKLRCIKIARQIQLIQTRRTALIIESHILLSIYLPIIRRIEKFKLLLNFLVWNRIEILQHGRRRVLTDDLSVLVPLDVLQVVWFQF